MFILILVMGHPGTTREKKSDLLGERVGTQVMREDLEGFLPFVLPKQDGTGLPSRFIQSKPVVPDSSEITSGASRMEIPENAEEGLVNRMRLFRALMAANGKQVFFF